MSRKTLYKLLTVLLAAVFLFSGGMLIFRQVEYSRSAGDYEDALQVAGLARPNNARAPADSPSPPPASSRLEDSTPEGEEALPTPASPESPPEGTEETGTPQEALPPEAEPLTWMDLDALRAVNPEVAGWLDIPGVLSYPLLHTQNNQFYLDHSWNGGYNVCGSIFLECTNSPDFLDFHTLVYGHRMDNDSMFGVLRFYEDQSFWQEHPYFYIADGTLVREYEIFAAFEADVTGLVYRLDLEEHKQDFIDYCLECSTIQTNIIPAEDDAFVTLSTCPRSGYDQRLVVMGRLVEVYA